MEQAIDMLKENKLLHDFADSIAPSEATKICADIGLSKSEATYLTDRFFRRVGCKRLDMSASTQKRMSITIWNKIRDFYEHNPQKIRKNIAKILEL